MTLRVLVVEDDPDIASLLCRGLGGAGYAAEWVETSEAALARVDAGDVDAAIIDMMLGTESGAELLSELRRRGHRLPAIMLSALARVEDRTAGLDAGAQDYLVKPFQLSELIARLEVQLRRAAPRREPLRVAGLTYDPVSRMVSGSARAVILTEREGELLGYMIRRGGEVVSRGEVFDALWAPHGGPPRMSSTSISGICAGSSATFTDYGLALTTLRGRGFMLTTKDAK